MTFNVVLRSCVLRHNLHVIYYNVNSFLNSSDYLDQQAYHWFKCQVCYDKRLHSLSKPWTNVKFYCTCANI